MAPNELFAVMKSHMFIMHYTCSLGNGTRYRLNSNGRLIVIERGRIVLFKPFDNVDENISC